MNIFNNSFIEDVYKALENYISYDLFKEEIKKSLMYHFWCKAEYEVMISDLSEKASEKIDVYYQLLPNLDKLCDYIIDTYNEEINLLHFDKES